MPRAKNYPMEHGKTGKPQFATIYEETFKSRPHDVQMLEVKGVSNYLRFTCAMWESTLLMSIPSHPEPVLYSVADDSW